MALTFGKDRELDKKKAVADLYKVSPSSENAKPDKKREIQQAVVAFSPAGNGLILSYCGNAIYEEIQNLGYDPDELGIISHNSPDEGIWIWEGSFICHQDWQGEWDCDVSTHQWREPTDEEFALIRKGECPFEPKFEEEDIMKDFVEFNGLTISGITQMIGRGERAPQPPQLCPKCNSEVIKKQCVSCGFSS